MKISELMTKKVIGCKPDDTLSVAAKLMSDKGFHALPVIENGELVGVVSESDFFFKKKALSQLPAYINFLKKTEHVFKTPEEKKVQVKQLVDTCIRDIMTTKVITCKEDDSVDKIIQLWNKSHLYSYPVLKEKKLVGIVTLADIIKHIK